MREILFRGKRKDNGEWVYGYLYITHKGEYEIGAYNKKFGIERVTHIVIPKTVGQYTGLTNKNGKKIFEGDELKCLSSNPIGVCECRTVVVNDITDYQTMGYLDFCNEIEVIGNIHDNPDLLKGGG